MKSKFLVFNLVMILGILPISIVSAESTPVPPGWTAGTIAVPIGCMPTIGGPSCMGHVKLDDRNGLADACKEQIMQLKKATKELSNDPYKDVDHAYFFCDVENMCLCFGGKDASPDSTSDSIYIKLGPSKALNRQR